MIVFRSLLNRTFHSWRRQRISDGQGGWEVVMIWLGTVEGRARPVSAKEIEVADARGAEVSHVLYLEAISDVARGDIFSTGTSLDTSYVILEVIGVREPSLAGEHFEIDCLERQAETLMEVP